MRKILPFAVVCLLSASCASNGFRRSDFATNLGTPDAPTPVAQSETYRISVQDRLSINVYQNKDLSQEKIQVDASGRILLPMVGPVMAAQKTTSELSAEISQRLQECCLQNPQVIVSVEEAPGQQITVTGAVKETGIYTIHGRITLTQALALAKGPDDDVADIRHIAVFRNINGRRAGALFDLKAIRNKQAEDQEIFGGDTIVVDTSNTKSAWHAVVQTVPIIGVFRMMF